MTLDSFDLKNAACGIAVLDDNLVFLAANTTLAGMLQTESATMVGQSLDQFLSAAHRLLFHMQAMTVLYVNGRVDEMALSLTGAQGKQVPVLFSAISRVQGGKKVIECVLTKVNERRRLEDELFNIKKAVEQVPGMVYQYLRRADGTDCIPYASEGVRTVYELSPAQLLSSSEKILLRIHPDDRAAVERSIAESRDTLSIWHHKYRVNLPERGLRWLEGHAVPEARADSSVLWHGYITDVTDRHHQHQATHAQLQLLETCVSHLNDIVLITEAEPFDEPGPRIIFVNDAFVRRTGYSREEVIGKTPRILQGAKTQRSELDRIGAALRRWEPVRGELINYTKAGEEFWLELDIVPIADSKGWYTHWVAVERDITQRKLAQEALQASEARRKLATDSGRVAIWEFDIASNCVTWDDNCFALYGISKESFAGTFEEWAAAIHPQDLDASMQVYQQAIAGTRRYHHTFRVVRPDGSLRFIETNAEVIRGHDGVAKGLIGVNWDITEQKLNEEALRELVSEKTALLKEVHHRVKNNMQVITSLLRLESGRSKVDNTKGVLGDMQARIAAMALLHESLYRTGTFASVDLGGYLRQLATQSFRAQTTISGAVQLELSLGSVQVGMDQAIPCGLLINELISNCFKHGFPAGVTGRVRIDLQALDTAAQWRLQVRDTGVGLPDNFEGIRSKSLGLQLASDLARQIGGELAITPNHDTGVSAIVDFHVLEPAPLVMSA